jgi:hypothetical protein
MDTKISLKTVILGMLILAGAYFLYNQPDPAPVDPQDYSYPLAQIDPKSVYWMPTELFARFKNRPDAAGRGSCVQASMSMQGSHHHEPACEYLLEGHPQYGPAILGGSWPGRVIEYCRDRHIPIFSVEGTDTIRWIEWALQTKRYAAITYGRAHMICAVGISPDGETFYICDNNFPSEIRAVSRKVFVGEHRGYEGGWTVILDTVGPPPWVIPRRT